MLGWPLLIALSAGPCGCPTDDTALERCRAAERAGAIRSSRPRVDRSTPKAAFCSYLDSYERGCAEEMYLCMSERMRRSCGCASCVEFCAMMAPARRPRGNGDAAVLKYYRGLVATIERQFANCFNDVQQFEVVLPASPGAGCQPSRLVFIREDALWRLDAFEVCASRAPGQ
jgi:hypothetical protein